MHTWVRQRRRKDMTSCSSVAPPPPPLSALSWLMVACGQGRFAVAGGDQSQLYWSVSMWYIA